MESVLRENYETETTILKKNGIITMEEIVFKKSDEILEKFFDSLNVADSSRKSYKNCVKLFLDWLNKNNITKPRTQDLIDYQRWLRSEKIKPRTINSRIQSIKKFYKFLHKNYNIENITLDDDGFRREKVNAKKFEKGVLTIEEEKQMLELANGKKERDVRDRVLLKTLFVTGCRACEITGMLVEDIEEKSDGKNKCRIIKIKRKGRTEKDSEVKIPNNTYAEIMDYIKMRKPKAKEKDFIFISYNNNGFGKKNNGLTTRAVERIFEKYKNLAGIKNQNITLHSTRHAYCTISLKINKESIYDVKDAMGHSSMAITEQYFHNSSILENHVSENMEKILAEN